MVLVKDRGSRIKGQGSRVMGHGSRVMGQKSRVKGQVSGLRLVRMVTSARGPCDRVICQHMTYEGQGSNEKSQGSWVKGQGSGLRSVRTITSALGRCEAIDPVSPATRHCGPDASDHGACNNTHDRQHERCTLLRAAERNNRRFKSHSSPDSFDECRPSASPRTKPIDLGCESAENWQLASTSTIAMPLLLLHSP